jgi:hypothetical protein
MREISDSAKSLLQSTVRQYRFKIELWNVVGGVSIPTVVDGTASTGTGYLDVTQFVVDRVSLDDPGDKRASQLKFSLVDYTNRFHPDLGVNATFLMNGQMVKLIEGDESIDEEDWVTTFTGHIRGQVGFIWNRHDVRWEAQVTAYGRLATPKFIKMKFTSPTYGRGVDYGTIITETATDQMGLSSGELSRMPGSIGKITQFDSNSIVDMSPIEAINKILETVGMVADFDGSGRLRTYSRDLRTLANKNYSNLDLVIEYSIPNTEIESYNSITVIGLDKNIKEIEQPLQVLARATVPVGFWRPKHAVRFEWTTDRSLRARNTYMQTLVSVNNHVMGFLGTENYVELSEFNGALIVDISAFIFTLSLLILAIAVAWFALPDYVPTPIGFTIPVGKILSWIVMQLILYTLSLSSSGQYEIYGNPILPVYEEITATVTQTGTIDYLVSDKEIRNDWLNTVEELVDVGTLELIWEVAQSSPRTLKVLDSWDIEIGDIIHVPIAGGKKIWVDSLKKNIGRGQVPILEINGILVPEGI